MFKARRIILIVILLLIAVYVAVAAYMGVNIQHKIENLSQEFNQPNAGLTVKIKHYDRGIFSSQLSLEIQYNELNTYIANLKLIHRPLMVYRNENGHPQILFLKLLAETEISEIFLDKKTELLNNVSVIDLRQDISLEMKLANLSAVLYQNLGLVSGSSMHNDALLKIDVNKKGFSFQIKGKAQDLFTLDEAYQIDDSDFKLVFNYDKTKSLEQNDYSVEFSAHNVKSNPQQITQLFLSNPKISLNFTGDLSDFLALINGNLNITELKHTFIGKLTLSNDESKFVNSYKDEIYLDKIYVSLLFDNLLQDNKIQTEIKLGNFFGKTNTDNLKFNNFKMVFDWSIDNELLKQLINVSEQDYSNKIFDHMLTSNIPAVEGALKINIDAFNGEGLLIGKFNFDNLNLDLSLNNKQLSSNSNKQQNDNKEELILSSQFNLNNFNWQYKDAINQIEIKNTSVEYQENFNFTEKFAQKNDSQITPYTSNYSYKITLPYFVVNMPSIQLVLNDLNARGDFQLTKEINGQFNNELLISSVQIKKDNLKLDVAKIHANSALKQKYNFIFVGKNTFNTEAINLQSNDHALSIQKSDLENISSIENDKLLYTNTVGIQNINLNKSNYGNLLFDSKLYDINVNDYEIFIANLNNIFIKKYMSEHNTDNELNIKAESAILDFIAQGFKSDTFINLVDDQSAGTIKILDRPGVKIGNIIRFETTNLANVDQGNATSSAKLNAIIQNANVAFNIIMDKSHIEKLINLFNNPEINKFYDHIQKIGLLIYNKDNANIEIFLTSKKILINNKDLNYWQQQLKKYKINEDYFRSLREIENHLTP